MKKNTKNRYLSGGAIVSSCERTGLSLEDILLATGEMEHMEKLIIQSARGKSGISPQEMLDCVIHPLLDELEEYIRVEVSVPGDVECLRVVVHQWIASRVDVSL